MLVKTGVIICLLFLFYQDMKHRAVYWIVFPILLILLFLVSKEQDYFPIVLTNSFVNILFLLIQLILLTGYFSIKKKQWINLLNSYLGLGDVLFLLTIAFYFSPANFLVFYIISLLLVLLATILFFSQNTQRTFKIPLAGLQSLFFALILLMDWNNNSLNLQNDQWILNYLQ